MTTPEQITKTIMDDAKIEQFARRAKDFLEELNDLNNRMDGLFKDAGAQGRPQNPALFLHGLLSQYALKKLESKIVTPN